MKGHTCIVYLKRNSSCDVDEVVEKRLEKRHEFTERQAGEQAGNCCDQKLKREQRTRYSE